MRQRSKKLGQKENMSMAIECFPSKDIGVGKDGVGYMRIVPTHQTVQTNKSLGYKRL